MLSTSECILIVTVDFWFEEIFSMSASVFSYTQPDLRFSLFLKCYCFLLQFKPLRCCKVCFYKNTRKVCFASLFPSAYTFDFFLNKSTYLWNHSNKKWTLWECHCSLLIPPENIKPLVFWCFQGALKEISGMNWVNLMSPCWWAIQSFQYIIASVTVKYSSH